MSSQNLPKKPSKSEVTGEEWVSPLSVNYEELLKLLNGKELKEYVGDKLPEEEVKRIETDYKIYLKNK